MSSHSLVPSPQRACGVPSHGPEKACKCWPLKFVSLSGRSSVVSNILIRYCAKCHFPEQCGAYWVEVEKLTCTLQLRILPSWDTLFSLSGNVANTTGCLHSALYQVILIDFEKKIIWLNWFWGAVRSLEWCDQRNKYR